MTEPLVDGHGRPIGDVRISVTDRCNFRCQYCMPAEGLPWLDRDELLRYEEIERLVRLLVEMGIRRPGSASQPTAFEPGRGGTAGSRAGRPGIDRLSGFAGQAITSMLFKFSGEATTT